MAKMYIAVTIGPINETLDLTSTPAALWYASSMFSFLTGRLCGEFRRELQGSIISPYYGDGEGAGGITDEGYFADGAGRFHDRIVCAVETEDEQQLKAQVEQCIERAKKAVCDDIYQQLEYPSDGSAEGYFTIHYIILPAETLAKAGTANAVLGTSDYLDGLELCPAFRPQAPDNSLLKLLAGTEDNHSYYIRWSAMFRAVEPGILTKNERSGNLRSIENIAGYRRDAQWKRQSYFAVVQADGDSMGKVLAQKSTDQDVTDFSRQCMAYAGAAAREVLDFGGMPIYAGGDDLLFLAPVVNEEGRTVFFPLPEDR
ncbi:MAG: hypothetical protein LUH36_00090 [Oscillospiraceae bacterium]|nr:hypothetical protein [Oscillospiraceae bacterium]